MKTILNVSLTMLLSLVLLVACGEPAAVEPAADPPTVAADPTTEPEIEEKEPEEMTVTIPDDLAELVVEMKVDLSQRAGVETEAITVVKVEAVTWNDGSLGCPQPGEMYTMALEPGYRLVLTADEKAFNYHTRGTSHFIYCENPQAQEPLPES